MKSKKIKRKLLLNRKTIANLDKKELGNLAGGGGGGTDTCGGWSCGYTCYSGCVDVNCHRR